MEGENDHNFFEGIVLKIRSYFETYFRLAYLSSVERISVVLSRLVSGGILLVIFLLFFFFFSLSIGYYIAEITGRVSLGFAIISGFYLVLLLVLYFSRNRFLKKSLLNFFVRSILKEEKNEDE